LGASERERTENNKEKKRNQTKVKGALGRTKIRQQLPPASQLVNKEKRISAELFYAFDDPTSEIQSETRMFLGQIKTYSSLRPAIHLKNKK